MNSEESADSPVFGGYGHEKTKNKIHKRILMLSAQGKTKTDAGAKSWRMLIGPNLHTALGDCTRSNMKDAY